MQTDRYPLLDLIDVPADLRELDESQLTQVADELRDFLVQSVSRSGGHFSSGLGCIELTVALHYLFDTPKDRIVWDVGHQAYPHKILTGRKRAIETIKKTGGLAPFPKRAESEFDTFGVGHSSTSISAALGMALASQHHGDERRVVAVIGDGALTAGMAFEALNHGGDLSPDLLVILNENQMSISPNVGGVTKMLGRVMSGPTVTAIREQGKRMMHKGSPAWRFMSRWEEHIKGMVMPSTLFEEFGFNYLGPIDGHDVPTLIRTIRTANSVKGPNLLHIITKKGKGYPPAEADPIKYHAVSPFDPSKGIEDKPKPEKPKLTYTQVFGQWLCDMAAASDKLLAITPAMREGSGLVEFAKQFPDRYFDVGIAEQHSVTLAAGMACEGAHPVVAIYSTFLQRAYDQLVHDVAVQNLPVLFAIDRAGLVGSDGPTHAGSFDLSYMRCIPNLIIMAPSDEAECRRMLTTGYRYDGPAAVRYPRGTGPGAMPEKALDTIPIGQSQLIREGEQIALLAFGSMVPISLEIAESLNASLVNMRFIKPLDLEMIREMANRHPLIVTLEENALQGGAGSAVAEAIQSMNVDTNVLQIGIPDHYIEHGAREDCLEAAGLGRAGVLRQIRSRLAALGLSPSPTGAVNHRSA